MIMETPRQKAREIFDSFEQNCGWEQDGGKPCFEHQKNCTIICVENIINSWEIDGTKLDLSIIDWWKKVLIEVENIKC
jgi:hypothetical protein